MRIYDPRDISIRAAHNRLRALRLYRSLLRQCSFLWDERSREYLTQLVKDEWRKRRLDPDFGGFRPEVFLKQLKAGKEARINGWKLSTITQNAKCVVQAGGERLSHARDQDEIDDIVASILPAINLSSSSIVDDLASSARGYMANTKITRIRFETALDNAWRWNRTLELANLGQVGHLLFVLHIGWGFWGPGRNELLQYVLNHPDRVPATPSFYRDNSRDIYHPPPVTYIMLSIQNTIGPFHYKALTELRPNLRPWAPGQTAARIEHNYAAIIRYANLPMPSKLFGHLLSLSRNDVAPSSRKRRYYHPRILSHITAPRRTSDQDLGLYTYELTQEYKKTFGSSIFPVNSLDDVLERWCLPERFPDKNPKPVAITRRFKWKIYNRLASQVSDGKKFKLMFRLLSGEKLSAEEADSKGFMQSKGDGKWITETMESDEWTVPLKKSTQPSRTSTVNVTINEKLGTVKVSMREAHRSPEELKEMQAKRLQSRLRARREAPLSKPDVLPRFFLKQVYPIHGYRGGRTENSYGRTPFEPERLKSVGKTVQQYYQDQFDEWERGKTEKGREPPRRPGRIHSRLHWSYLKAPRVPKIYPQKAMRGWEMTNAEDMFIADPLARGERERREQVIADLDPANTPW